jgi:hypothetical protein
MLGAGAGETDADVSAVDETDDDEARDDESTGAVAGAG